MRRIFVLALLALPAGCAWFEPSGQRFVVFFQDQSALVEDAAPQVIAAAAAYSMDHPDRPVQVDGFADKNGPPALVADITRQRVQNVIKGLTSNGVPITHIARREVGGVTYSLDSQESRRVVIVVGNP